jgi:hypothetical protein
MNVKNFHNLSSNPLPASGIIDGLMTVRCLVFRVDLRHGNEIHRFLGKQRERAEAKISAKKALVSRLS